MVPGFYTAEKQFTQQQYQEMLKDVMKVAELSTMGGRYKINKTKVQEFANEYFGGDYSKAEKCVNQIVKLGNAYDTGKLGSFISKNVLGVDLGANFNFIANNETFYNLGVIAILEKSLGVETDVSLGSALKEFISTFNNLDFSDKKDVLATIGEAFGWGLTAVLDCIWGIIKGVGLGAWELVKSIGRVAKAAWNVVSGNLADATGYFTESGSPGMSFPIITGIDESK